MWWFAIQIVAYFALVVGYLLLLVVAVRGRIERGRAQRLLETIILLAVLWALSLGLVNLFAPDGGWTFVWQRAAQVGLVFLALLTSWLADAFVGRPTRPWPRLGVVALPLAGAVAVDLLSPYLWAGLLSGLPVPLAPADLATCLLGLAWLFPTIVAWWTSIGAFQQATNSKHRNRIRYLLTSLLAFGAGDILVLVDGPTAVYLGLTVRLAGFGLITFALMRYSLPDIRRWILNGVRFILLVVLTAAIYLGLLLMAGYVSGTLPAGYGPAVVGFLLALLIATVLDMFLRPRLQNLFDRVFLGRVYDVQKALRVYSQQTSLILDLDRLADTTLDWLETTMQVQRSAFILFTLRSVGQVELKVLRATITPPPGPQLFRFDGRFITHFRNIGHPLSQYELDMLSWFQAMPDAERRWLKELALDLYVPILVGGEPVALLALGSRAGGQPYSDDDLETLVILAAQTGTALENVRLVDDLRAMQADLHRLGTELAETNRHLQRLDQTKADFIAIASHELRTPLTQIYGYSDVLATLSGDQLGDAGEIHSFIEGISRGAMRLKRVVDAMVDMSLIETGEMTLHLAAIPLSVIVRNAVETVRPGVDQRGLTLDVHDLSGLPYVWADSVRLEQVFVGLLSNAIKFSPDGTRILVSGQLHSSSDGEGDVEILVADAGIGIDRDQQELIFEKFYRAESALLHSSDETRFKGGGPGLGLTIAKGIVDAHGGQIWVESPGRDEEKCPGSTFHVRLPVAGPRREEDNE